MIVEQLYTKCLAQGAYFIESEGEAAVIDPLREPMPYIELAEKSGAKIKYIFETHFHADFVSGHLDLARLTGATIVYGPRAETNYPVYVAQDGEEFTIGKLKIKVIHTPGHTPESTTYLLYDENGEPHAIFTGDTLFIGDVGRPDLAIRNGLTKEDLAGMLYDSLRNKIMPLPDHLIVYPAHGAGSACGKSMSKETYDTLGNQKKTNWALQPELTKEQFIKEATNILPPPQYFAKNAQLNKKGYNSVLEVLEKAENALDLATFEQHMKEGALVLDVRSAQEFAQGHIPGALNIGLDGMFAIWVGTLVEDLNTPIVLITPEGREEETVIRLARVGYDNVIGYLSGGIERWKEAGKAIAQVESIPAEEFARHYQSQQLNILDVRKPGEYTAQHIPGAQNVPLDYIYEHLGKLDKNKHYYVHCAGGYRSMIACSILKRNGFEAITDIAGGFNAIKNTSMPLTQEICPTTGQPK